MKEIAELLNEMRTAGVISNYAMFGAIAQMRYTQPVATLDVDILVAVPVEDRLDVLRPIYEFCARKGHRPDGEAVRVGAWPVQFIPVFSALTREAMEQADTAVFEGAPLRVVRPEYLALIAVSTGRTKDFTRVLALLESGSVTADAIAKLAAKHGLSEAWKQFQTRFLND